MNKQQHQKPHIPLPNSAQNKKKIRTDNTDYNVIEGVRR